MLVKATVPDLSGLLLTTQTVRATLQKVVTPSTYTSSELPPVAVQAQVTFFCMMFSLASTRQIQYTSPPSVDLYKSWLARSKQAVAGYEYAGEDLIDEDGLEARILWIGAPWKMGEAERKVVLYFHGGGFISPLNDGHLDFVRFLKENLKEKYGQDVAIGVVEYSLPPFMQ